MGDWADDILSGGGYDPITNGLVDASNPLKLVDTGGRRDVPALPVNAAPTRDWADDLLELPQVGVTLEGLDAEAAAADQRGFKPWTGPDRIPMHPVSVAGKAKWGASADPNASVLELGAEGLRDAVYSGAGGVMSGLGINPGKVLGPDVQASLDMARERSPVAAPVGQALGEAASQVAATAAVPGASAVLAANPALSGAVSGGLSYLGNAEDPTALGGLEALGTGAVLGKGGDLVAEGVGALGDAIRRRGLRVTAASSGAYGGELKRMAENMGGREGLEDLGQWMRDEGVAQPWRSAAEVGDAAQDVVNRSMGERQLLLDDLAGRPQPVMVHTEPVAQQLEDFGRARGALAPALAKRQGAMALGEAQNLRQAAGGTPLMSFEDALANREAYDQGVNWVVPGGPIEDKAEAEVNRLAGNGLRGGLVDALDAQAPELSAPWQRVQNDIHQGLSITKPAARREFQELGNQTISLPTLLASGAAGGALGGGIQALRGEDTSLGGVAAAVGAGAGMALLKSRGKSAIGAGEVRLGQGLELLSDMVPNARVAGAYAGRQDAQKDSRGYLLPQAVMAALQEGGAELGPYAAQFAEATKQDGAINALLAKLRETDMRFRMQVLPKLQARTSGGQY